jgi:hypothetical protein
MKPTDETTQSTETAALAEQGATTAPEQPSAKKGTSKKKGAPKAKRAVRKAAAKAAKSAKPAKAAKPAAKKAAKAATDSVPREFSKKAIVLELLRRKDGATMAEIAKATDWQNHSIRGFISGNLVKKMGLAVESSKNDAGERTYKIAK